jgi:hypothetical protein
MTPYKITKDYHAVQSNCTTVTLDGTKPSGIDVYHNAQKYQELRGLSWTERQAAKTQTYPAGGIFMPFDLQAMLEGAKTEGAKYVYNKKNTYRR